MQQRTRGYARWTVGLAIAAALLLSAACSSQAGYKKIGPNSTAQEIYTDARDEMDANSYDKAVPLWERLEGKP